MISTQKLMILIILLNLIFSFATDQGTQATATRLQNAATETQQAGETHQIAGIDPQNQQQKVAGDSVGIGITWWKVILGGLFPYINMIEYATNTGTGILATIGGAVIVFIVLMNMLLYYEIYLVLMNRKNT